MNKSAIFKTAHKLTKKVIKSGDDYRTTLGASIKLVLELVKANVLNFNFRAALGFDFKTTRSGKKVIKVEVDSIAYELLHSNSIVELTRNRGRSKLVEINGFGEVFEDFETDIAYQYAYINLKAA